MHRFALVGLGPMLFTAICGAQDAPIVTEAAFLAALDESHPAVVEAAENRDLARARAVIAGTLDNPVLGYGREDLDGPSVEEEWTVSWQLPQASRGPTREARRQQVEAAEARYGQTLLELRLAMREVYGEWAVASARRDRLAAQARRVAALARREEARAEKGEASGLEARRLALAAAALEGRAIRAAAEAEAAWGRARAWNPALSPGARPELPPLPPPGPSETGDEGAHALVAAAQGEAEAARLEEEAANRFLLTPEIALGWKREEGLGESSGGPVLGLAWSVPLFNRNQGEKALAEARSSAALGRLKRVEREVSAARGSADARYRNLAAAWADVQAVVEANGPMLAAAEEAFRLGEGSLTDLLDTHRSAAELEMEALDLHAAALAALRDLERLGGAGSRARAVAEELASPGSAPSPSPAPPLTSATPSDPQQETQP